MCGACPGGGRLSEGTLFLAQRLSPARTAQLVSALTGDRLRVTPLGDGWSVGLPTGGMSAVSDFEGLVRTCGPYVRADALSTLEATLEESSDPGISYILEHFSAHRFAFARTD